MSIDVRQMALASKIPHVRMSGRMAALGRPSTSGPPADGRTAPVGRRFISARFYRRLFMGRIVFFSGMFFVVMGVVMLAALASMIVSIRGGNIVPIADGVFLLGWLVVPVFVVGGIMAMLVSPRKKVVGPRSGDGVGVQVRATIVPAAGHSDSRARPRCGVNRYGVLLGGALFFIGNIVLAAVSPPGVAEMGMVFVGTVFLIAGICIVAISCLFSRRDCSGRRWWIVPLFGGFFGGVVAGVAMRRRGMAGVGKIAMLGLVMSFVWWIVLLGVGMLYLEAARF